MGDRGFPDRRRCRRARSGKWQGEHPGDRLAAANVRVVPKMERIGFPPKASLRMTDEPVPGRLRPMFHRVDQFVERERPGQRQKTPEKNRGVRQQPLDRGKKATGQQGKHHQRVPREKRGFVLVLVDDRVTVFHQAGHCWFALFRLLVANAGQRVVQRVLLVEMAQKRKQRGMEHIAVKENSNKRVGCSGPAAKTSPSANPSWRRAGRARLRVRSAPGPQAGRRAKFRW